MSSVPVILPIMTAVLLLLVLICALVISFIWHVRAARILQQQQEIHQLASEAVPVHVTHQVAVAAADQPKIVVCEGVMVLQPNPNDEAQVALVV
jgi:hypothetical protein